MITFETIEEHEVEFGEANFLRVSRKIAKDPDGEIRFLALTRGLIGHEEHKTRLVLPDDPELLARVHDVLGQLLGGPRASPEVPA